MDQVSSLSLALAVARHLVLVKENKWAGPSFATTESLSNDCKEEKLGKEFFLLSILCFLLRA